VTFCQVNQEVQQVVTRLTLPPQARQQLVDALPSDAGSAIASVVPVETDLTFEMLKTFLSGRGCLRVRGITGNDVVALVMPNGPELAVALLLVMSQARAAPLELGLPEAALAEAFVQLSVTHVIALRTASGPEFENAAAAAGVTTHYILQDDSAAGLFFLGAARHRHGQCTRGGLFCGGESSRLDEWIVRDEF
jgi:hypothetical protein